MRSDAHGIHTAVLKRAPSALDCVQTDTERIQTPSNAYRVHRNAFKRARMNVMNVNTFKRAFSACKYVQPRCKWIPVR